MMTDTISVVVPVYYNQLSLEKLCAEIIPAVQPVFRDYEIILIDDGSGDGSWNKILELSQKNPKIKGIKLSRNFGQQVATSAGIDHASHDWICTIDADLQDHPENIPLLYARAIEGFDIVLGITPNKKTSTVRKLLSKLYFVIINQFTGQRLYSGMTSFTLFNRKAAEEYRKFSDLNRNHLFILLWIGLRTGFAQYSRDERNDGKSSYTFASLMKYALSGIYFFPASFIQYFVRFGFLISFSSIVYSVILVLKFYFLKIQPGWTSLAVLISFFGGLTISSIGIVGLYVGKIFEQVKQRPLYVIEFETGSSK